MRFSPSLSVLAVVVALGGQTAGAVLPVNADRIWFTPVPGAVDYRRLFEHPEEWDRARSVIRVFKFYQQHTQTPAPSIVGPNSYDALVRAGAFRALSKWGIKTALEVGAVKAFWCTPDASGMQASIRATLDSVKAVQDAGGNVAYLAMDEPWVSGRQRACGGPALEPTADRLQTYMSAVRAAHQSIRLGLIEAYPFSSAAEVERMLVLLRERGVAPAFLHLDVDWHALKPGQFAAEVPRIAATVRARGIPFGIIIWGYNGDADPLFASEAADVANLVAQTFQTWEQMPDQIVFQSWAVSQSGLLITPSLLPEERLYTHTNLLWDLFRRLLGSMGGNTGRAVPRGGA
jgi:hypothetical protein